MGQKVLAATVSYDEVTRVPEFKAKLDHLLDMLDCVVNGEVRDSIIGRILKTAGDAAAGETEVAVTVTLRNYGDEEFSLKTSLSKIDRGEIIRV